MGINRSFFLDYLGETLYRKGMTQAQEEGHDALLITGNSIMPQKTIVGWPISLPRRFMKRGA